MHSSFNIVVYLL